MFLALFLSLALSNDEGNETIVSCKLLEDGSVRVLEYFEKDSDAWAKFTDSYESVGWGKIHIWSNPFSDSYNQMYCAGYADAYSTHDRIKESFKLYKEAQGYPWKPQWVNWFYQNIDYMRKKTAHPTDSYWKKMGLILAQFDGMVDGYAASSTEKDDKISTLDFWILQSAGDLDDLDGILTNKPREPELTLKCTGLIKILPGHQDVFFAQDTWSDYRELHAYLKEYNLNVQEFKSRRVQVSTRTGHLPSVDDFWTNDKGLLVLETTMHNFNKTLYDLYVKPESVLTWVRSYYATFSSDNGEEWTKEFIRENSGTYNNEYLVLDTKKFKAGRQPDDGFLWIIEQYPGIFMSKDITDELLNRTYFPSVNTPWFQELYDLANYSAQDLDFFTYYDQPRTKVIFRDAPGISNYDEFQKFMRYDNYTTDPILSNVTKGNVTFAEPSQGILSRYDLRPKEGTPFGKRNHFGGLDSKTARLSHFKVDQSFDAINSPEYAFNEAWNFTKWNLENPNLRISHDGLPDVYNFSWTDFKPIDYCYLFGGEKDKDKCINIPGCGFCIYNQRCMLAGDPDDQGQRESSDSLWQKCPDGFTMKEKEKSYAVPLIVSVTVIIVIFVTIVYISAFYRKCFKKKDQGYNYV